MWRFSIVAAVLHDDAVRLGGREPEQTVADVSNGLIFDHTTCDLGIDFTSIAEPPPASSKWGMHVSFPKTWRLMENGNGDGPYGSGPVFSCGSGFSGGFVFALGNPPSVRLGAD